VRPAFLVVVMEFSKQLSIVVPGEPVAKGRPKHRVISTGGKNFTQTYTPAKTRNYENLIRAEAARVMGETVPYDCRLWMVVTAYRSIPKSMPKKHLPAAIAGDIAPITKPDSDNYLKAALDGLNTVVFRDDSLVADVTVRKRYSDQPRLVIEVFVP